MSTIPNPCPFCGNEHPLIKREFWTGIMEIYCPECDIWFRTGAGEKQSAEDGVVKAWNRRPETEGNPNE